MTRLSGTFAARPSAGNARGARYYATDTQQVYLSYGSSWQPATGLDEDEALGHISGANLAARPDPNTCIGYIWVDESTGNEYEAFPNAWALIRDLTPAPEVLVRSGNDICLLENAGVPTDNVQASLSTNLTGTNNDLTFAAVPAGADGNAVTVRYLNPAANNVALSVAVVGNAVTVTLATNGSGVITSTAAAVAAALAIPSVTALFSVANKAANDGTGVVTAMAATPLAGGVSGTGAAVAAKGSLCVDRTGGGLYRNTGTKAEPVWAVVSV